jgi:hypothetical protein
MRAASVLQNPLQHPGPGLCDGQALRLLQVPLLCHFCWCWCCCCCCLCWSPCVSVNAGCLGGCSGLGISLLLSLMRLLLLLAVST